MRRGSSLSLHTSLRERRQAVSFRGTLPSGLFRWVGDQRIQMLLHLYARQTGSPSPRPVDDRKDAARLTLAGDELGDLVWNISYCLVYLCPRFAILSVLFNNCLRAGLFVVGSLSISNVELSDHFSSSSKYGTRRSHLSEFCFAPVLQRAREQRQGRKLVRGLL